MIGWSADARKLVRVSGIDMRGKFYFNGDMSDDQTIAYYVSDGYRWMTISIFEGRISSITYHLGIDIFRMLNLEMFITVIINLLWKQSFLNKKPDLY